MGYFQPAQAPTSTSASPTAPAPGFAGTGTAGTGASVTGNTTGTQAARVQAGVGGNGMPGTTVSGNTLAFTHQRRHLPQGRLRRRDQRRVRLRHLQPQPADAGFDGCV